MRSARPAAGLLEEGGLSEPVETPASRERLRAASAYLEGLIDVERRPGFPYERFGLDRIRKLLARVGNPEAELSVCHIAGSKGKGSTALWLEALLSALGERVGTYTSPHLERWTERFRIEGSEVEGDRLAAALEKLRPEVEALRAEGEGYEPSFFDVATAAGLLLFREEGVDRAILEVGLGGRLDSTNIVDPAVSCITSIELEHTDRLGNTLAAIAGEKAGVIKPGRPVISGRLPEEAMIAVRARAEECGAPLRVLDEEFFVETIASEAGSETFLYRDEDLEVTAVLPCVGRHQVENAALAIACIQALGAYDVAEIVDAVRRGFPHVRLRGRIEVLSTKPVILVDSAHTKASARALAEALGSFPQRRVRLLLSLSADKETGAVLGELLPVGQRVWTTQADNLRSLPAEALADRIREFGAEVDPEPIPNPEEAVRAACADLEDDELLCITGSVYLAGAARAVLRGDGLARLSASP